MRERTVGKTTRYTLAEGAWGLEPAVHDPVGAYGAIGGIAPREMVQKAQAAGVEFGDRVRLVLEVDEPKIDFPTGDGWCKPHTWGRAQAVMWEDGNGDLRIRCAQYSDGSRGVFCQCDLQRHWQPPFSTEALRAIAWRDRRPDARGALICKAVGRVIEANESEGD